MARDASETVRNSAGAELDGLVLVILRAGELVTLLLPVTGEVSLGRGEGCEARIDDKSVSRRHAVLSLGERMLIEDLGSANGTRVRDVAVKPGQKVELRLGEVATLGNAMVIVQRRAASTSGRRVWPHAYFEARLEEECLRAAKHEASFALLRVHGDAGVELDEILRPTDVLGSYGPGEHEILLLDTAEGQAREVAARLEGAARARGRGVRVGMASFPQDGGNAYELVARACLEVRGAAAGGDATEGVLRDLERVLPRVASGMISVLILGETGVGKEVLAERIHQLSPRAAGPFLRLHCAALSESLLESELFGHERGAFTGAERAKPGLLETADQGTVFLDEVGELPASIQVKLLRVLEDRCLLRVGALAVRPIDVRFVAATNRDLEREVARGAFRQDLFFRLNGFTVVVPPLRERVAEIGDLAHKFLRQACAEAGRSVEPRLSREALELLRRYRWPGNIRELRNVLERAVLLCAGDTITSEHLPLEKMVGQLSEGVEQAAPALAEEGAADERDRIVAALARCGGNQSQAAKLLGMARGTLVSRLDRYGLVRPRKRR